MKFNKQKFVDFLLLINILLNILPICFNNEHYYLIYFIYILQILIRTQEG